MDNKNYAGEGMPAHPPPYSAVGVGYPGSGKNHPYPPTGAGIPLMPQGMVPVPDVGFVNPHNFSGGSGGNNMGFMPPPMGFNVPLEPDQGHNKEESRAHLVEDPDSDRMKFSEKTIRMAFIRKVYSILMVQLMVTTGIISLFCFHGPTKYWVQTNQAFTWISYGFALILLITLACCESIRRKSPANIILLGLFTLTYGIVVGTITTFYRAESVVLAAGVTVVVCLALTLFSFQTKWDFTTMGGMLFVGLIILFLFGFLAVFLRSTFPMVHMIYAAAGALLFSFYLVYDTQLMIGGNHKYSISPEEYIFASLNIYTDVILIFLKILSILGHRN